MKIAANVYTPAGYDPAKSYPALVVAHPNGGVKEQVAGLYSQRMAEAGYICLAFDAAYQGASEGEPRNTDKPAHRIEDIRRAADILLQYPGVDAGRLVFSASVVVAATRWQRHGPTNGSRQSPH